MTIREEFEQWAESMGFNLHLFGDSYKRISTDAAWRAWQACADRMVPILQLPVFQFDEGVVVCGFMEHDSGYGITLHKSAVAGVAGQHVSDENIDKLTTPLAVLLFTSESHARDVYRALIAAPEPKP